MSVMCGCEFCRRLNAEYADDPALLAFYRKKLLIRGWAGRTTPTEKGYILAHSSWAQAAAENGRRNLVHLSNARDERAIGEGVVLDDLEGVLS